MYYGSARLTLKLVALEGVDFAGKTTLANALDGSTIGGWILRSTGEMRSALGSILRASVCDPDAKGEDILVCGRQG